MHYRGPRIKWERDIDKLFEEIITGNFLNPGKEIDIQVQEEQNSKQDEPKEVHIIHNTQ